MAESAIITRLGIAAARTWQNKPSRNKSPDLSLGEKYNSLFERFIIEVLGTLGYMGAMHLGQDVAANLLETRKALNPAHLVETLAGVTAAEKEKIAKAVEKVFGDSSRGLIARTLYDKANLSAFWHELNRPDLLNNPAVRGHFEKFAMALNRAGSVSLLSGIAAGALFGGVVVQWLNDRFVGPVVEPFLARLFGLSGTPESYAQQNTSSLPSSAPGPSGFAFPKRPANLTEAQRTFRC